MKHMIQKLVMSLMVLTMLTAVIAPVNAHAATVKKDGYYSTILLKKSDDLYVKKVTMSSTKLVTYGSVIYTKKAPEGYDMSKIKKVGKRTFTLAKNCKCYSTGGDAGAERISKKAAYKLMKYYNGLGLELKVKNGKVTKITIAS